MSIETRTFECDLCEEGGYEASGDIYGLSWEEDEHERFLKYNPDKAEAHLHICGECRGAILSIPVGKDGEQ